MKIRQPSAKAKPGSKSDHATGLGDTAGTELTDQVLGRVSGGPTSPPNIRPGSLN